MNTEIEWKDPNKQGYHTFGDSPAAERLYQEIQKPGCNYRAAIRILNQGQTRINDLYLLIKRPNTRRYFLYLLRNEIVKNIAECSSDDIVKSLCRNVFVTKIRMVLKVIGRS